MPKKMRKEHLAMVWNRVLVAAQAQDLADVLFYASRLVDNLLADSQLPVIHLDQVDSPATQASLLDPSE